MSDRKKNNQKGMTYAEVAVCLFVMALIITPLCTSLVSSVRTRTDAEALSHSTFNTEALMEDVKEQLTLDIAAKNRLDGSRAVAGDPELPAINPNTPISYLYQFDSDNPTDKKWPAISLQDFLRSFKTTDAKGNIVYRINQYNTERYAYEVMIWNMKDAPLDTTAASVKTLKLNVAAADKAVKLYSDDLANVYFKKYSDAQELIKFNISNETETLLKEKLYKDSFIPKGFEKLVPAGDAAEKVYDLGQIVLKKVPGKTEYTTEKSSQGNLLTINETLITDKISETSGMNKGVRGYAYSFEINPSGTGAADIKEKDKAVVILDLRQLVLTDKAGEDYTPVFKFVNKTLHTVTVKLLRNNIDLKKADGSVIKHMDDQFNVIAEKSSDSKNKIIIERVDDIELEDTYLIAMVIRDKKPTLGQPGKIVKRMADVYSYTSEK